MSDTSIKTFDAVEAVRAIRDDLSSKIASMSVEEENRWLRSQELSDPRLQHLMGLAPREGIDAKVGSRRG